MRLHTDDGALLRTGISIIGADFHPTVEVYLKETLHSHVCRRDHFYLETPGSGCPTSSMLGWPVCGSTNAKVFTSNLLTWEWDAVLPWLSTGTELLMLSRGLGHLQREEKSKNCNLASIPCMHTAETHPSYSSVHTECLDAG